MHCKGTLPQRISQQASRGFLWHACPQDQTSMLARMFNTDWAGRNRVDEKVGSLYLGLHALAWVACHISSVNIVHI